MFVQAATYRFVDIHVVQLTKLVDPLSVQIQTRERRERRRERNRQRRLHSQGHQCVQMDTEEESLYCKQWDIIQPNVSQDSAECVTLRGVQMESARLFEGRPATTVIFRGRREPNSGSLYSYISSFYCHNWAVHKLIPFSITSAASNITDSLLCSPLCQNH